MCLEFRLKNIDETRHYFLEERQQNELMSRKHRKVCTSLNYIKHFLILSSTIDVQLINKFNKRTHFLLCVIDIFSKCAWVIPLEDKKYITITNAFQKILDEPSRKPNNI